MSVHQIFLEKSYGKPYRGLTHVFLPPFSYGEMSYVRQ